MSWLSEFGDTAWRWWAFLTTGRTLAIVLGVVFALIAIALFIASRTRWGQAKPLTKFVVVSVLLHIWLLMYAMGNRRILPQGDLNGREQNISVAFETYDEPSPEMESTPQQTAMEPWEEPLPLNELPKPAEFEPLDLDSLTEAPPLLPSLEPTPMPALPPAEQLADLLQPEAVSDESNSHDSSAVATTDLPTDVPPETSAEAELTQPSQDVTQLRNVATTHSPVQEPQAQLPESNLPEEYRLRQAPNRLQLARAFGADADSEAAVEAGLKWLADAQGPQGGWVAAQHGGGTETYALGEDRNGTGDRADTGITGLALLAFLSAGHTHMDGDYQATVRRALEYLLDAQMPSGDLSGPKQVGGEKSVLNARMYCHSIASLALAEAYAMTQEPGLKDALIKAAQYSINAQDVRGGGWRYRPGDPGDLSQFGWQAMALKSVERSGIAIPVVVKRRMQRFLDSCSAGQAGGLARYRPGEGRPSETMTAESLACRLLLNYPLSLDAQQEATQMIMSHRPGSAEDNVYFWYYATLALFQLQDENWRVWNQAMKARLLTTQIPVYEKQAGSWNPDQIWGGYGGRVYSTAMSCLCLEVYYRYLPMYQRSNLARGNQRGWTSR